VFSEVQRCKVLKGRAFSDFLVNQRCSIKIGSADFLMGGSKKAVPMNWDGL
jgi:hypothetical protein